MNYMKSCVTSIHDILRAKALVAFALLSAIQQEHKSLSRSGEARSFQSCTAACVLLLYRQILRTLKSFHLVATCSSTPLPIALKCALPQRIFKSSRPRKSSSFVLPLVSKMKYSFFMPSISTYTAQSGLYVPIGVSTLKRLGSLKNIFTSGSSSNAWANGFSTVVLS